MIEIVKELSSLIRLIFYYVFGLIPAFLLCFGLWFVTVLILIESPSFDVKWVMKCLWTVGVFVLGHAGFIGICFATVFPPLESSRKNIAQAIGLLMLGLLAAWPIIGNLIELALYSRRYNTPKHSLDPGEWAAVACASVSLVYLAEAAFAWARSGWRRRNNR